MCQRVARERTYKRGVVSRACAGETGAVVSFKLRPHILLTFHSEFGEFDLSARNAEVSFGFDTEAKRLLYVHKEPEE